MMETLFPLGQILATPGVLAALEEAGSNPLIWIFRHAAGDWGTLSADDMKANSQALKDGSRILSAYLLSTGVKIWVITEAEDENGNRVSTTLLRADEY
ncbi:MAG TPA: hypothetical protein VFB79_03145 [Candidatus Angelobacter sp.]|nr:hypothetical protein [Candidatus Angelobacter sp.]